MSFVVGISGCVMMVIGVLAFLSSFGGGDEKRKNGIAFASIFSIAIGIVVVLLAMWFDIVNGSGGLF